LTDLSSSPSNSIPWPTLKGLGDLLKRGDIALAFGVLTILVVLILPLPALLLDFALAISIIFSILILMVSLFIHAPLEFSVFPTVLLIATMLRLALNLASTRLILSHGHEGTAAAGHVIEAFGNFVMAGNFVIGVIVFTILVIVNFVVITKGSGRIAEVAARFNLDAMPGKQMAIDADLSAGLIDEVEAKKRRKHLEDESSFYGAMDGASKFVRGDAIAGLLVVFINVIGGMIIGIMQQGISFSEAASSYTVLTVGDGLVTQIPALIVSTAAGLLVSKAGLSEAADKALFRQVSTYPNALGMSGAVMMVMSLLPGIPLLPFMLLGGGACGLAYVIVQQAKRQKVVEAAQATSEAAAGGPAPEEPIATALKMDDLKVELGYALLPLVNSADGNDRLTEQIKALRRSLASEMGFVMPAVRILDNVQLDANGYVIKIKEVEAGTGRVWPNQFMVMDPTGNQIDLPGVHTTEPTFGLPATWVDSSLREEASVRGLTVVDAATVLATNLTELI
jgi:flagellar biosynthesis protein FlhA